MTAKFMETPFGKMPIRKNIIRQMQDMTDREIADATFANGFINPEYFAELCHRKLCFRGDMEEDVYQRIDDLEQMNYHDYCDYCAMNGITPKSFDYWKTL